MGKRRGIQGWKNVKNMGMDSDTKVVLINCIIYTVTLLEVSEIVLVPVL